VMQGDGCSEVFFIFSQEPKRKDFEFDPFD
jgi:hypothetical protein